jgi:hypothetical protein
VKDESPAARQRRAFETARKRELLLAWVEQQCETRAAAKNYGTVTVTMVWEAGHLKRVEFNERTTVEDLTEKEAEAAIRGRLPLAPPQKSGPPA